MHQPHNSIGWAVAVDGAAREGQGSVSQHFWHAPMLAYSPLHSAYATLKYVAVYYSGFHRMREPRLCLSALLDYTFAHSLSTTFSLCHTKVCGGLLQWIPPHERAKAVSLSTSGMYLGSAAGMLLLPSIAARAGPGALLKVVGGLGFAWLAFWLMVGKEVPHR